MAQRLIRQVCAHCKENYAPQPEIWQEVQKTLMPIKDRLSPELQKILVSPAPQLVRGRGCEYCSKTGFLKRQPIIEVLIPSEKIEGLVAKKATIAEFEKAAVEEGMITMEQDGLMRALQGTTTIEEVWRVTRG
jgi:type IV pilus assembly protein PilB